MLIYHLSAKNIQISMEHTLFVGEIKLIHTENRLTKKTLLDISKVSPTLYLGADNYITVNKSHY